MPTGQIGQELFQLFVTGECAGHLVDGSHVSAQPKDVVLFRGMGLVLAAYNLPQPKDC